MDDTAKLAMLKSLLNPKGDETLPDDAILNTYLSAASLEILAWRYSYLPVDNRPTAVPSEYEMTQICAVIAGYSISGAEGETSHSENGISRHFEFSDMVAYIRSRVIPCVGVLGCDDSEDDNEDT